MDLTTWVELVIAIVVLIADFWAGSAWQSRQIRRQQQQAKVPLAPAKRP